VAGAQRPGEPRDGGALFGQDRRAARANSTGCSGQGLAEDGDRLSNVLGGMQQSDLAVSLVGSPRLLLIDGRRPASITEPHQRDAIRSMVRRTTSATTQYLDEADHLACRVVIIDHGRAVATGTPNELKRRVGRNVVEVHVRDRQELPTVANELARIGEGEPEIDEATRRIGVRVGAGTDELRDVLGALDAVGVTPDDVALRPPTLDEVFLALTGRATDESTDQEAA
jgi:ABC-2 type transport system ATP-binding protein